MDLTAVVMAAGSGTRMKSSRPKVLHEAAGRPLVFYPVRAALAAGAARVVVVVNPETHDGVAEALGKHLPGAAIELAIQAVPRGTGDAARVGLDRVHTERVLILSGDTPVLSEEELTLLVSYGDRADVDLCFLSCVVEEPFGYGRVLRSPEGRVLEIREQKDLETDEQRSVREINAGVYAAKSDVLRRALAELTPDNSQGEYYLTDVVALITGFHPRMDANQAKISGSSAENWEKSGIVRSRPGGAGDEASPICHEPTQTGRVEAIRCTAEALVGVNDRVQLRAAEQLLFERIARSWGREGVTIHGHVLIDDTVVLAPDVVLEDGVRLRGATRIGRGSYIDVGSVLTDCTLGEETWVKPYSVLTESAVGNRAQIGPFSHLRPESTIEDEAHLGNFVETKKTRVRKGAKANHLAYLGDGDVGEKANLGAGTIFCNYDGFRKHQTVVGAGAFVGSDSQLIAPVRVGRGAYVATGTTVTEDVPDDGFAIGRCRQTTKPGYAPRLKERLSDPDE